MITDKNELNKRLARVKVLLLDVDGVLTSGSIMVNHHGAETLAFHVRDGLGIRMILEAGLTVGIVTGRSTPALKHRCNQLGIPLVFEGISNKVTMLDRIVTLTDATKEEIAFVGDDIPDVGLMKRVGLAIAVADAHSLCIESAHMVTRAKGGCGAVREVCESILIAQGLWENAITKVV